MLIGIFHIPLDELEGASILGDNELSSVTTFAYCGYTELQLASRNY